jgi:hypothetical protein
MLKILTLAMTLTCALCAAGCGTVGGAPGGIMMAVPGDPIGSANIGTGSVTVGSVMPEEAKSAGIGIGP